MLMMAVWKKTKQLNSLLVQLKCFLWSILVIDTRFELMTGTFPRGLPYFLWVSRITADPNVTDRPSPKCMWLTRTAHITRQWCVKQQKRHWRSSWQHGKRFVSLQMDLRSSQTNHRSAGVHTLPYKRNSGTCASSAIPLGVCKLRKISLPEHHRC